MKLIWNGPGVYFLNRSLTQKCISLANSTTSVEDFEKMQEMELISLYPVELELVPEKPTVGDIVCNEEIDAIYDSAQR